MTSLIDELYTKEQLEELNRFEYHREVKEIESFRNVRKFIVNCLMCNEDCVTVQRALFRKKFCSHSCSKQSQRKIYRGANYRKNDGAFIECKVCKQLFWQVNCMINFRGNVGKTCSKECASKLRRFHRHERAMYKCQNIVCDKIFEDYKSHPKLKYCSLSCATAQINRTCRTGKNAPRYGKTRKISVFREYTDKIGRVFKFRSSYEIAFARDYLDKNNLTWDYEPKTFVLENTTYTPDFYIKEHNYFVEVKGYFSEKNKLKMQEFEKTYTNVSIIIATKDVLETQYEIKNIRLVTDTICREYQIRTFARKH